MQIKRRHRKKHDKLLKQRRKLRKKNTAHGIKQNSPNLKPVKKKKKKKYQYPGNPTYCLESIQGIDAGTSRYEVLRKIYKAIMQTFKDTRKKVASSILYRCYNVQKQEHKEKLHESA